MITLTEHFEIENLKNQVEKLKAENERLELILRGLNLDPSKRIKPMSKRDQNAIRLLFGGLLSNAEVVSVQTKCR